LISRHELIHERESLANAGEDERAGGDAGHVQKQRAGFFCCANFESAVAEKPANRTVQFAA